MPIGLFDTETPLLALREQIAERLIEVVERGVYILGPEVKAFEQEFAEYLGVKHVIGVGNGIDGDVHAGLDRDMVADLGAEVDRRAAADDRPGADPRAFADLGQIADKRPLGHVFASVYDRALAPLPNARSLPEHGPVLDHAALANLSAGVRHGTSGAYALPCPIKVGISSGAGPDQKPPARPASGSA